MLAFTSWTWPLNNPYLSLDKKVSSELAANFFQFSKLFCFFYFISDISGIRSNKFLSCFIINAFITCVTDAIYELPHEFKFRFPIFWNLQYQLWFIFINSNCCESTLLLDWTTGVDYPFPRPPYWKLCAIWPPYPLSKICSPTIIL